MSIATDETHEPQETDGLQETHEPDPTRDSHESDAMVGPHGAGDHGESHGHDDHAHGDGDALGPLDFPAWGAGALGIIGGLIVAAILAVGAGWLG